MRTELGFDSGRRRSGRRSSAGVIGGLVVAALLSAAPLHADPPTHRGLGMLALLQAQGNLVFTGDHTVEAGDTVDDIVVVGGNLRVLGTVKGDAVVVGGDLIVERNSTVDGDAVVTGGQIINHGGIIGGEMRMLRGEDGEIAAGVREAIAGAAAGETRREATRAGREAARAARETARMRIDVDRGRSWFDPIKKGFAGLISTLALGLVLAGIGSALIFYGRPHLDAVSDTLRTSTLRSMGVGLAAGFLVIPAFVVLVVALAVSIIGIPLLLIAVPLYPLVIAAAVAMGLLAASHAIGERTAEQRSERFDLRHRNAYSYLFTGLGMLLTPLLVASLLQMTGFLGFLGSLLQWLTYAVIWAAATAGFGAVILSRLGTLRSFGSAASDADLDRDLFFEDEHTARGPHA